MKKLIIAVLPLISASFTAFAAKSAPQTDVLTVIAEVSPLTAPGRLDAQRVDILLEGKRIGSWTVDKPGSYAVAVPAGFALPQDSLNIKFILHDAAKPKALGLWNDSNVIALFFKRVSISGDRRYSRKIDFSGKGNAGKYAVSGWFGPEGEGRWTSGKEACLAVDRVIERDALVLKAFLSPMLAKGRLNRQRVIVYVNGAQAAEWVVKSEGLYKAVIPAKMVEPGDLRLKFVLPDAVSPRELGLWNEPKPLGVFLRKIFLEGKYNFPAAISFRGSSGDRVKRFGWMSGEAEGSWTCGNSASLAVNRLPSEGDIELTAQLNPLVSATVPYQKVYVLAGGKRVAYWEVNAANEYKAVIPKEIIERKNLTLKFLLPDAASPKTMGLWNDNNIMGLFFTKIELKGAPGYPKDISFGSNKAARYQKSGWLPGEKDGSWTNGKEAVLVIPDKWMSAASTALRLFIGLVALLLLGLGITRGAEYLRGNYMSLENPRVMTCALAALYLVLAGAAFALSLYFKPTANMFGDELVYKNMAESFYLHGSFYERSFLQSGWWYGSTLYTLCLVPCFLFGEGFFTAMKVVNSLLISLAVFPAYLMLRQFNSRLKSLAGAAAVGLMPFATISMNLLAETLFFPMFLFAFYFGFRALESRRMKYAAGAGLFLALLFLVKPHASFAIAAFFAVSALLIVFSGGKKHLLLQTAVSAAVLALAIIFYEVAVKGSFSVPQLLGMYYGQHVEGTMRVFSLSGLISVITGHLAYFFLIYLVPFAVSVWELKEAFSRRDRKTVVFLSFMLACLLFGWLMVFKHAVDAAFQDKYSIIITRYYAALYPVVIAAFLTFSGRIEIGRTRKWILGIGFGLAFLVYFGYVRQKFQPYMLTPDLMLFNWFSLKAFSWQGALVAAAAALPAAAYIGYADNKFRRLAAFVSLYTVIGLFSAHDALASLKIQSEGAYLDYMPDVHLIKTYVADKSCRITIIDNTGKGIGRSQAITFWLPNDVKIVYPPGIIPTETIPVFKAGAEDIFPGADWVVTIGGVTFADGVKAEKVAQKGDMALYKI